MEGHSIKKSISNAEGSKGMIKWLTDADAKDFDEGSCVTIGNFDGVHLGHQTLLERVCRSRANTGLSKCKAIVLTFDPHPSQFFSKGSSIQLIESLSCRLSRLRAFKPYNSEPDKRHTESVDDVLVINFDKAMADTTADNFIQIYLKSLLNMKHLVVGYDFCFGKNREGTIEFMSDRQTIHDYTIEVIPPRYSQKNKSTAISSTAIRAAIQTQHVDDVTEMLGRPYEIHGVVGSGAGRGAELGFPTANINFEHGILPENGIYIGQLTVIDNTAHDPYPALISIGVAPTFNRGGAPLLEVYVIDKTLDLRTKTVTVGFLRSYFKSA